MDTIPYQYPKGHPKEGKTTTITADVWQCDKCNYTSNLSDDIAQHSKKCNEEKIS